MRYRTLGDGGLLVSAAGLGCNDVGGRVDVRRTAEELAEIDKIVPPGPRRPARRDRPRAATGRGPRQAAGGDRPRAAS